MKHIVLESQYSRRVAHQIPYHTLECADLDEGFYSGDGELAGARTQAITHDSHIYSGKGNINIDTPHLPHLAHTSKLERWLNSKLGKKYVEARK